MIELGKTPRDLETLGEYIKRHGIKYFSERELLRVASLGRVLDAPPVELWPRIIPTLRLADELRERMGLPLSVSSCWRPADINKRVGGASKSAHVYFRAIDLNLLVPHRDAWTKRRFYEEAVAFWKRRAGEPIGLGLYTSGSRVHLDTLHKPYVWSRPRRVWSAAIAKRFGL
jgi:uncharacterized protein YcbK (DUF882 family)